MNFLAWIINFNRFALNLFILQDTIGKRYNKQWCRKRELCASQLFAIGLRFRLRLSKKNYKKLCVFLSSNNVFTLTGYTSIDSSVSYAYTPVTSNSSDSRNFKPNPLLAGDDNLNTYVLARTINFGINVGFWFWCLRKFWLKLS